MLLRQLCSRDIINVAEFLIFKQLSIFIALILIFYRLDFEVIDAHSGLFSIMYELHDAEDDNIILDSGSVSVKEAAVSSNINVEDKNHLVVYIIPLKILIIMLYNN